MTESRDAPPSETSAPVNSEARFAMPAVSRTGIKTALVTGDAGLVGSAFTRRLTDEGFTVFGVDLVRGEDARDFFRESVIQFDLVVHCAAVVGGRAKIDGAPMEIAVDLAIDALMWEWALRTRPGRVVYLSSSAAYPIALQTGSPAHRLNEQNIRCSDIVQPDQTYGLTKLVGEVQAELVRAQGVKVTVVRPFSGYSAEQSLDYPTPSIVGRAVRREDPIEIWSDAVRDFVHLDDIVGAVLAAIEADVTEPFNVGTGVATSFSELARLAAQVVGYEPDIRVLDDKPTGVAYRVADPTFLNTFYSPAVTLEQGIAEMVQIQQGRR